MLKLCPRFPVSLLFWFPPFDIAGSVHLGQFHRVAGCRHSCSDSRFGGSQESHFPLQDRDSTTFPLNLRSTWPRSSRCLIRYLVLCCHHRSPTARDRWHPHLGWGGSPRPWPPACWPFQGFLVPVGAVSTPVEISISAEEFLSETHEAAGGRRPLLEFSGSTVSQLSASI